MHLELVEILRCPQPHEALWLVASVNRLDGRVIVDGVLGCPICRRQYPVVGGEVDFTGVVSAPFDSATADAPPGTTAQPPHELRRGPSATPEPPSSVTEQDDQLLRARALLALDGSGGTVLLGGALARHAPALEGAGAVMTIQLNAPASVRRALPATSAIRIDARLPIAAASLRAVWLDATASAVPGMLSAAASALRRGGRLVAPADVPLPPGVRELARDAREWVAESDGTAAVVSAPAAPVPLRRR